MSRKQIKVSLDDDLYNRIKALAEEAEMPMSTFVRTIVADVIEANEIIRSGELSHNFSDSTDTLNSTEDSDSRVVEEVEDSGQSGLVEIVSVSRKEREEDDFSLQNVILLSDILGNANEGPQKNRGGNVGVDQLSQDNGLRLSGIGVGQSPHGSTRKSAAVDQGRHVMDQSSSPVNQGQHGVDQSRHENDRNPNAVDQSRHENDQNSGAVDQKSENAADQAPSAATPPNVSTFTVKGKDGTPINVSITIS